MSELVDLPNDHQLGSAKVVACPWCSELVRAPVLTYYEGHVFLHPQFGPIPSVDLVSSSCPKCEKEVVVQAWITIALQVSRA